MNERFQANSGGVLRSIFYDGTIINQSTEELLAKEGHMYSCIGLVADDPLASAKYAAALTQQCDFLGGYRARPTHRLCANRYAAGHGAQLQAGEWAGIGPFILILRHAHADQHPAGHGTDTRQWRRTSVL